MSRQIIITLQLIIEDPILNVVNSLGDVKEAIENSTQGSMAKVCHSYGTFLDAEVKEIKIIDKYEF